MYELLDKSTEDLPARERYLALLELDHFIESWKNTPFRQSFMGINVNCWKFRDNLCSNLGNFEHNFFKYENNENWQYWDYYVHRIYGGEGLGHAAVSITICGQKFYFDDGWWGYIFRPGDIPFCTLPIKP